MSVVKVDSHRRLYVPKEIPFDADRAIIIPQGSSFLLIPVPREPIEIDISLTAKELKGAAEGKARREAQDRAKRRRQL